MVLIAILHLSVIITLVVTSRRCLENALPYFSFFLVLLPGEAKFIIPGLFDLSAERVALATLLVLFLVRGKSNGVKNVPLKNLMYLHAGWALCSTLYSLSVATSFKQLLAQVLEYYLLYYLFVKIITDVRTIYRIVFAMMMAIGLCCVFALLEAYARWSVLSLLPSNLWVTYGFNSTLYIEEGRGLRVHATFPHPILFGDALAMSIPLALYLVSVWKERWRRILLWIALPLMLWALYKTSSRGPWLALVISLALLFLLVQNRIRKYLVVLALLSAVVFISRPGIQDTVANLYASTTDADTPMGSSYEYRHALMHAITSALNKEPARAILGYGLGTFRQIGLDIDFLGQVERWQTCDNNWALFMYETGYVGLVIIGALLFSALAITIKNYRRLPRPERYFSGVLFISIFGFCFMILSVAGYSWGQQSYMAWMLIALSVVYGRLAMQKQKKAAAPKSLKTPGPETPREVPTLQALLTGTGELGGPAN